MGVKLDHGKQAALARAIGMAPQQLNDIIHGRKKCPGFQAMRLSMLSQKITGQIIPTDEWIMMGMGLRKGDNSYDSETVTTEEG